MINDLHTEGNAYKSQLHLVKILENTAFIL